MKKNHVLMVLAVLLLMPAFLFAGGTTEVSEEMGPVTLWSEVNIKAPQTNLDENFAKAVEGIEEAMGTELIVVTTPYKEIDAKVNLAVQAGGDVPDVTQIKVSKLAFHIDITAMNTASHAGRPPEPLIFRPWSRNNPAEKKPWPGTHSPFHATESDRSGHWEK